ncbi:putative 60S ribosomal protein L3 [Rosellinia necatrix]|uniref:Putative 60S ribosomal protein L3 n=1 Tax=Rosellinia necatrix TaxID=77044 RepID=A0A1W2TL29_ROSNE|nr:putative 60S ribosomal protein L3 [Rosellinia necatrix]
MSHNHDHYDHDHGHGHDHGHDHDHDHSDDITPVLQKNLYQHIEFDKIVTLNEHRIGAGKEVVKKTWQQRLEPEPELLSDTDEQLIIHVPFTGQVKLHAIKIRGSLAPSTPKRLRLYINRDDIDFDNVEDMKATQEFQLSQTSEVQDIMVTRRLFSSVQRLTLFFMDNFAPTHHSSSSSVESDEDDEDDDEGGSQDGCEKTQMSYLGFQGDWMQLGRAPVNILYEAAPNPNDHALKGTHVNAQSGNFRFD